MIILTLFNTSIHVRIAKISHDIKNLASTVWIIGLSQCDNKVVIKKVH